MTKQPIQSVRGASRSGGDISAKTISQVLGIDPVLPGESAADYRQGLEGLIAELGAKTVLQVYLAEKIYDALWWIRRYEDQKRTTIIAEMAAQTKPSYSTEPGQAQFDLRESLLNNDLNGKALKAIAGVGHSIESLRQSAMAKKRGELQLLDTQIALQTKILSGFQTSYELAVNRKLHVERLGLQNAMLRRDIGAIEGEASD